MPINSRQKGKRGELELCHTLMSLFGWKVERSVQYNGNAGDADLIVQGFPDLFVESKRVQKLDLSKAMRVAKDQSKGKLPVICHRKNGEDWMITLPLDQLMRLSVMVSSAPRLTLQAQSDQSSAGDTT